MKSRDVLTFLFLLSQCMIARTASARAPGNNNDHEHEHGGERESDGSFRPRDYDHYTDEGEHRTEFDHEVFLGSVRKAEEFARMSLEESREAIHDMVPLIDLDGDNLVTRSELKEWILKSLKSLAMEEASERMLETDTNKNGEVSWSEYLKEAFGVTSEDQVNADDIGDTGMLMSEEKEMWEMADKDGDGELQLDEFSMFINAEEHEEMHPFLVKQTLGEKDTNEDGVIDFKEFIGDRSTDRGKEWVIAEKDKFDNDLDTNRDGKLDEPEIKAWIIPNNNEVAEEEVEHLFAAADDDHDDTLSLDEIMAHIDVFGGSNAADADDADNFIEGHADDEL